MCRPPPGEKGIISRRNGIIRRTGPDIEDQDEEKGKRLDGGLLLTEGFVLSSNSEAKLFPIEGRFTLALGTLERGVGEG